MGEQKITPKCPRCGETTNQYLRGWEEGYMKYRCGHCKKSYKVMEDGEDIVKSSQLGFQINDKEANP
ncbi:MAG TPA: hypothetical protein VMW50_03245 [Dehalococcoidia bacterium]|nr:hypothetical protein [Dehalococcoidia bacterium]